MADIVLFYSTAPDRETAEAIARRLVEEGAAACVNILGSIGSVYRWRGAVETANEVALIIKTTRERAEAVRDLILARHPYDNPAVIAFTVDRGLSAPDFCAWIENPD